MGKFVIRRTSTGYKFDLKASNGENIATSEVYATQAACEKGAQSVAQCAATANFADLTVGGKANNPKFELYEDKAGGVPVSPEGPQWKGYCGVGGIQKQIRLRKRRG